MDISVALLSIVLFILISYEHCEAFLEDVCDKDDVECQHPNDSTVRGHLQHGKSSRKNVIRRIRNMSLLQCVKECFLTSECIAINYRKNWKLCDAVGDISDNDQPLVHEDGCIYSEISTWSKSFAGVCADHNCATGKKCVKDRDSNRGFTCISAYCKASLPEIQDAVCTETFGLYKNLGTGISFECKDGLVLPCTHHVTVLVYRRCGSGVYTIYPSTSIKFDVYCEMDTEDVGWTVIQRRLDGSTDFYRGWTAYEEGFGNLTHNFWLGNAKIHKIVAPGNYQLRVELEDFEGNTAWAEYTRFFIGDASTNYRLEISGYKGTAGDSLAYHNGQMFSTYDRDNDIDPESCAVKYKGAWWYQVCHYSNLNGAYLSGRITSFADGVIWYEWKGHHYSLKSTRLMIKKL
ncbi:Angiopoietin-related protein 1,Ficolin-1-A,Angiopoietin-1,Fibrinogen C domain-containing protein 1,Ryncolin-1,Tenascin-N,Angiopoietin-related protein 7,Angiopoietin-related protein 6,Ficolin-3,Fibrinogen C domain-containing protein 1-B,Fibroleukin,Fibrinogen-like protein 1,Ficolin-1,Ficolin-1-B,Angiopoietin-4,Tenascin-R,Ryncolin-2,Techylectin-5B,Fibrinogen C domain-containing protein 1-A,Microfibril-associated glycoprotein 4,Fibrinogen-like protein A,Ryncolin-3,Fibrinogen gamma chain,Angiopoietin-2,Tenasci|uniref:Fibrinogen C-terminal domain-containing protein n=1 Tax=Mytilus edulis TaxID=6550 RepID=A0A8S3SZM0_MYTED|nr:Angiopoietin-related protein 1,Ficolin-1-A,Angiopoietin-1,Fibrinogen C domain-containing protein 1,Ryncolin-1,Tenascin-N,Angiopoietin-related protein 7,Angiopoietin-related protein 6,Ficolin-3,Fibrinogen C domain-containing protein 1-B,Fibroleukin,Fibrinogen-like protein 1,Ficolin-1,Ficolin-1-B,Angiopoietin-4,Tenascin-R,Ryncolin-2,Techylectin-5B,Fibrinogen C domain-containing protein 1-A,Microfibril-associated glycoprotein 4,Fibrinogen-like protein A,Ryncolin-3,Fibrinogen gamma chain,Angiopoieti